jgi:predicted AlkP superfamily phosphohydrolase/phosphomutase
MTETIVLGLDGATWDVLDPLIENGDLPQLQRVRSEGNSGTLESTFPPITAPAWLSMATGQNPGKTGVFYFLNRDDPDSFEFEPLGSDKFQEQSFWDVLAADDQSVGIFNYPMLYPPYETDGFMVSGLGSDANDAITYPESLGAELDEVTDGYQVKVPYADPKYKGRPDELERDLLDILDKRERAIEYLLTEKDPDHFFGIISATDWAQHYFWRYHDEKHVLYDPTVGNKKTLARIWKRVDETVGKISKHAQTENANLLIVSDHGFGPTNRTFYSNKWLEQEGFVYPVEDSPITKAKTKLFPYLRQVGEAVIRLVPPINIIVKSVGKSVRPSPSDNIDFDQSIAFAPEQNLTCGMIYMLSDDPTNKQRIISELEALTEQPDGPEEVGVHVPEELYEGSKTNLAPDILFQIDNFECEVDPRSTNKKKVFTKGPSSEARNGGHNQEGIVIASGPDMSSGDELGASIYDIAPTLLYLHDAPLPEEMDGKVLDQILHPTVQNKKEIKRRPIHEIVTPNESRNRNDSDTVQERLEDLGYI